jgi:hypothetical protein
VIGVWRRWRKRRECFHHDHHAVGLSGASWIDSELIDGGKRKMFTCLNCRKKWFV